MGTNKITADSEILAQSRQDWEKDQVKKEEEFDPLYCSTEDKIGEGQADLV